MKNTETSVNSIPGEEEQKKKNRLLAVVLVLAVVAVGMIIWLVQSMRSDDGWRDITARGSGEPDLSGSISFRYKIDRAEGGRDHRAVSDAYTEGVKRLYKIFDISETHEGIKGLRAVNDAPGEAVTVEPELYEVLSLLEKDGGRYLYLAPVYAVYNELFFSSDDVLASAYDPYKDPETAAYFAELMPFINDPEHVQLELLGSNTVRLTVSEEYRAYAEENDITAFLDLYWMTDAFALDLLAEKIAATGYTRGYLVSREGWVRCLDASGEVYAYDVQKRQEDRTVTVSQMRYKGPVQIVSFHDHTADKTYADYYFAWPDGSFATAYIDPADGYYKSALHDLIVYSEKASCAELLLAGAKMVIREAPDQAIPEKLDAEGIWTVYFEGNELRACGTAEFIKPE